MITLFDKDGDEYLISYRVWPDGTVQEVDEADAYSHMSDDFAIVEAFDEEDALFRAKIDA